MSRHALLISYLLTAVHGWSKNWEKKRRRKRFRRKLYFRYTCLHDVYLFNETPIKYSLMALDCRLDKTISTFKNVNI